MRANGAALKPRAYATDTERELYKPWGGDLDYRSRITNL